MTLKWQLFLLLHKNHCEQSSCVMAEVHGTWCQELAFAWHCFDDLIFILFTLVLMVTVMVMVTVICI
jgi:hypothetical protein